jgi:5-(carboxyamino)imidazole ribonucleotide mutase
VFNVGEHIGFLCYFCGTKQFVKINNAFDELDKTNNFSYNTPFGGTFIMVGIIMGSLSDLKVMQEVADALKDFGIAYEIDVVSAHRTPEKMVEYAKNAKERGLMVIVAGAGGAAHLPGMVASLTTLPVVGVPIKSSNSIDGWDSVLSILQMPAGVPVATVALNGGRNAGILAAQIVGVANTAVSQKLEEYKTQLKTKVEQMSEECKKGIV